MSVAREYRVTLRDRIAYRGMMVFALLASKQYRAYLQVVTDLGRRRVREVLEASDDTWEDKYEAMRRTTG